ncbi:MAG: threonine/serine dehydratase, partial [Thaumarchaeota archaeon]
KTPLYHYASLNSMLSADVYVKHENHLPTGAFKVRGGINLISRLSEDERRRGVIAASTGNHAQSVAFASKLFGVRALIVMPENSNPLKVLATKELGAEVIFHGKDFDEAREFAEELASKQNYRYIHSANEPLLIAGVATHTLEILEDLPNVDVIIVPVGGGSGAAGASIVAKSVNPKIRVIGVQSEKAPAAFKSWKDGKLVTDKSGTFAEGLATRVGFELTQRILRRLLDDFVLVSEEEIRNAMIAMIEKTHNLAEAAGASPLAAAQRISSSLKGKKVVLILSGGNTSLQHLREALLSYPGSR